MPSTPPPGMKPRGNATQKTVGTTGPGRTEVIDVAYEGQRESAFNATPRMTSTSSTTTTSTTSTTTTTTTT